MVKIIKNYFSKRYYWLDLLIILILGGHVFIGLKPGYLYIGGDFGITLSPIKDLNLLLIWQNLQGGVIWWSLPGVFMHLFFAFFEYLGLGLSSIQHLYIYFAHTLSGLSMYFLVNSFPLKRKRITSLTASIFYMFSPWIINYMGIFVILPYSVVPLVLGLFVRGATGRMNPVKSSLLICLALFGVVINFPQYSMYFVTVLLMFWFIIFYFFTSKIKKIKAIKYIAFLCLLIGLTSLWVTLPYFSSFSSTGTINELKEGAPVSQAIHNFGDFGYSTVLQLLRMCGAAGFMSGGATYTLPYLSNPLLIIINYFFPLLAFSAVLLKPKSKSVLFFASVAVIYIFLAKGVNAPYGRLHFWLVNNLFLARAFRTTWNLSLGANIAYAFLIGVTISQISKILSKGKSKRYWMIFCGFVVIIFINSWPLLNGDFFQYKWNPPTFDGVKIPSAYFELENYFSKQKEDFRFLKLPESSGMIKTDWGYLGSDFSFFIFPTPFISGHLLSEQAKEPIKLVYKLLEKDLVREKNLKDKTRYLLKMLNVKHLVFDGYDKTSSVEIKDNIEDRLGLIPEAKIGEFSVYRPNQTDLMPHFYLPQRTIYFDGSLEEYLGVLDFFGYEKRLGVFLAPEAGLDETSIFEKADEIFIQAKMEEKAEAGDVNCLVELIESEDIFYPYAKHRPGTFMYRLALMRENADEKKVGQDIGKLLEKKLFYASKRISELEKWKELGKGPGSTLAGYQQKMEEAIELVKNEEMRKAIRRYLGQHRKKVKGLEIEDIKDWEKVFDDLERRINPEAKFDFRNLKYKFNIPRSDNYELFIKNIQDSAEVAIEIDNEQKVNDKKSYALYDDWVSLSEKNLKKGEHQLAIHLPEGKNLLDNNWQPVQKLDINDEGIGFYPQGFFPQNDVVCQSINNWQEGNLYHLSFEYKTKLGLLAVNVLEEKAEFLENKSVETKNIFNKYLKGRGDDKWEQLEVVLSASKDSLGASVCFHSIAEPNQKAEIDFRNLKAHQIAYPQLIFRESKPQTSSSEAPNPKITFSKVNSTKYLVSVEMAKEPYYLVFSEGFHKNWKAYIRKFPVSNSQYPSEYGDIVASYFNGEIKEGKHRNIFLDKGIFETWGKKPISEEKHFLINGYANSWYLTPEDSNGAEDYEIVIEFVSQRIFYIGAGIFLFSILSCLGYLGFVFIKNKNRRKE